MTKGMSRVATILGFIVALGLVAALVFSGIAPRLRARQALVELTNQTAAPPVSVVHASRAAKAEEVILPATIQAFIDAPIYARTNGYVKRWYFDIGARVKQGDLLAEIDSPEVDQQLLQAREDLNTAQANLHLSEITAERYSGLFKTDSVAKQDVDNAVQDAAAKSATVKSAQANVDRLLQMVAFEKVVAPFTGVVTARNTDVGQLIESGPSQAGAATRELFHVSTVDKLRVFVNVPQVYSHETNRGMHADLTVPEMPGRRFTGTIVRTADAMDPATRTLLVELDIPNSAGQLFPGAYAEIHFAIKGNEQTLVIPSTSLIFGTQGLRVPVIAGGSKISLLPVTVGRDFGTTVEVLSGLPADAAIVANPPDSLVEGEAVRVMQPKHGKQAGE
ncbi:MAG TPA: efflux RND transporter periplasmic adaptor subunit [Bryobacteraceae bacterium]|nr:efflux RND transporter periplasmic adaptor subunit [Bryobacteraceae bacterium]